MSIEFLFLFNGKCRTFSPGSFYLRRSRQIRERKALFLLLLGGGPFFKFPCTVFFGVCKGKNFVSKGVCKGKNFVSKGMCKGKNLVSKGVGKGKNCAHMVHLFVKNTIFHAEDQ